MTDTTIYRFLRVLEYVGTREALDTARERRQVKGTKAFNKDCKIFEGILGDADQPVVGQLHFWCLQQIVDAEEGKLQFAEGDVERDGYVRAMTDVLRFVLPQDEFEKLCGGQDGS